MKNHIQPGNTVTVPSPTAVKSGDLVVVGGLVGIAQFSAASGDPVEITTTGVFELSKVKAQAWAIGAKVYSPPAGGLLTTVDTDNILIGHALEVAANPSDVGIVRLSV